MLYVFDLDFTLWDCGGTWCDHTRPPYRKEGEILRDASGRYLRLYPDVPEILADLAAGGYEIAAASRTSAPDWAEELLILFGIHRFFDYKEIYPGSKLTHFRSLKRKSGRSFKEMRFFDDERRNVEEIRRLGVPTVWVQQGLQRDFLESGTA